MLRLSSRARYALRSMIALARFSVEQKPVSLATIANRTNISRGYLEQVAIQLKNASLIRGVSGKGGGYIMTRSPSEIKVGEVIEAVIGPINIVECVQHPDSCLITDMCECRKVYVLLNGKILSALNSFTIEDLAKMDSEGEECFSPLSPETNGEVKAKSKTGSSPCMTR